MQAYLFVHFREKTTPDGEQVYIGVSKDGFNWEEVNGGAPVLWAFYGGSVSCSLPLAYSEQHIFLVGRNIATVGYRCTQYCRQQGAA